MNKNTYCWYIINYNFYNRLHKSVTGSTVIFRHTGMFVSSNIEQSQICNIPVNSGDFASICCGSTCINYCNYCHWQIMTNYVLLWMIAVLFSLKALFHSHFLCYILLFIDSYTLDQLKWNLCYRIYHNSAVLLNSPKSLESNFSAQMYFSYLWYLMYCWRLIM